MKNSKFSLIENIFSVRNEGCKKVIRILGVDIGFKSKFLKMREELRELAEKIRQYDACLHPLQNQQELIKKIVQVYALPSINRDAINSEVELLNHVGINTTEVRTERIIVSLTSYPKRMYDVHLCIYSLLTQTLKPDAVILWLSRKQFPEGEKNIPQRILDMKQWGLSIQWCDDYRSYKKIIPALKEFPNDVVITADDDLFYAPDWLQALYSGYQKSDGKSLIAHRCHKVLMQENAIQPYTKWRKCIEDYSLSFYNFSTNGGGTLFPPGVLHDDATNYELASSLCPTGDDIWIWGMAVRKGTKIQVLDKPQHIRYVNTARELGLNDDGTLFSTNKRDNDCQIAALCNHFQEVKENLQKESAEMLPISVVVPIYNSEKDLPKCLTTLEKQTLHNIEIICVNDGSTDKSGEVLNDYAKKYTNIRIINQSNKGAAAARNAGIRCARGEYIAFVDADDNIEPEYLKRLYNTAIGEYAEVAMTDQVIICNENGVRSKKNVGVTRTDKLITSIDGKGRIIITSGIVWNKIYLRTFLKTNDIYFPEMNCTGEDNYFTTFALLHAKRIAVNHDATYEYRMRSDSQTHTEKTKRDFILIEFYKKIEMRILNSQLLEEQKYTWLHIINERKKRDYDEMYKLMNVDCKAEFRTKADEHLAVQFK